MMNLVKVQDTKLMHRNLRHFYTLTTNNQREKLRKQFHLQFIKKNKIPAINLPKELKEVYLEKYKVLMKEIEEDSNEWKDVLCS